MERGKTRGRERGPGAKKNQRDWDIVRYREGENLERERKYSVGVPEVVFGWSGI